MNRVYEGSLGFRPSGDKLILLPDNGLLRGKTAVRTEESFYFFVIGVLYKIKRGRRYRIKHRSRVQDDQTGKVYLRQGNHWTAETVETAAPAADPEKGMKIRIPTLNGKANISPLTCKLNIRAVQLEPRQNKVTLDLPEGLSLKSTNSSDVQFESPTVKIPKNMESVTLAYYYHKNGVKVGTDRYLICLREEV